VEGRPLEVQGLAGLADALLACVARVRVEDGERREKETGARERRGAMGGGGGGGGRRPERRNKQNSE
jgi:hypothetical protein